MRWCAAQRAQPWLPIRWSHRRFLTWALCKSNVVDALNRLLVAALGRNRPGDSLRSRGHGKSGQKPMSAYSVKQLANDLVQVFTVFQVSGRLTLMEHSIVIQCNYRMRPLVRQTCATG